MPGRYIAFVKEDAIKEAKLDSSRINTINTLRNSGLPSEGYTIFGVPNYGTVDDLLENNEFRKLDTNPEYKKLYLTAGN